MKLCYEVRSNNKVYEVGKIKILDFATISENNKLFTDSKMIVLYKKILPFKSENMHDLLMNIFDKAYNIIISKNSRNYSIDKNNFSIEFKVLKLSRKEAKLMIKTYDHMKRDLQRNTLYDREQYEIKNRIIDFMEKEFNQTFIDNKLNNKTAAANNDNVNKEEKQFLNKNGDAITDIVIFKSSLSDEDRNVFWVIYKLNKCGKKYERQLLLETDEDNLTLEDCKTSIKEDSEKIKINTNLLSKQLRDIIGDLNTSDNDIIFIEDASQLDLVKLIHEISIFDLVDAFEFDIDCITVYPCLLELIESEIK